MVSVGVPFGDMLHGEIDYGDQHDGIESEIPRESRGTAMFLDVFLLCELSLVDDGIAGVEEGPVAEKVLFGELHFDAVLLI